ncbi:MAG: sulfite exporter TauE/SafE family protein [Burkholderiales bacterium]|nr:sulfite exporter TauE/SafE family protein [Burkholderiales bacterium]
MDSVAAFALAMLAAGLASGAHCILMCGGIVAAFDARPAIPVRPAASPTRAARRLAFNAGRLTTYAAAGAAAGSVGAAAYGAAALPAQQALAVATGLALVLAGLYLAGGERLFTPLEAVGAALWRRLRPLAARAACAEGAPGAYAAGLVWGWLPCAMVYAALVAAAAAGSAARGALAMAAFGLGTLPFVLAAGWFAARLARWRRALGALLVGFGVWGLAHAGGVAASVRGMLLCP